MIFEAIFRVRDLIFSVGAHINIYFTEKIFFWNLDNLEAAPGRPAPELAVKTPKWLFYSLKLIFFWQKKYQNNILYYRGHLKANLNLPGGRWRLILEASQVQIQMSYSNMPSCMSKCRFLRVRILIFTSKIISGHLEDAGG